MPGDPAHSIGSLANDFPPRSEADWRALVDKALKDAPFDTLKTVTRDGIAVEPIYPAGDVKGPLSTRPGGTAWEIIQRVDHSDPDEANSQALIDLENGASGLALVFSGAPSARGAGLPVDEEAIKRALAGVHLGMIEMRLQAGPNAIAAAGMLAGLAPPDSSICFGVDPIDTLAATGTLGLDEANLGANLLDVASDLGAQGHSGPYFEADGRIAHNAGATDGQELAMILASIVDLLRRLEHSGADLDRASAWFSATIAADADQFATIAKCRALRLLWRRVLDASGLPFHPLPIHAETSWRMMTRQDPHVNLLRTTIATFAAGIGGADSISVLPFTAAHGLPDAFARRIARNTQLILLEESGLARVADAAAGAGYPEHRTRALADVAWRHFQDIEREDGIIESLKRGALQARIAEARAARAADIATASLPITGTSAYATLDDMPVSVVASSNGATPALEGQIADPLPAIRDAEPFETLRDAALAHAETTGTAPTIAIVAIGDQADYGPRLTWTQNLLAAGGIAADIVDDLPDWDAARDAIGKINGPACLCASNAVYDAFSGPALTAGGSLYCAGKPRANLENAGVDRYFAAGMDVLDALSAVHDALGVAKT